jgi:protein-tyrosine phosphatase
MKSGGPECSPQRKIGVGPRGPGLSISPRAKSSRNCGEREGVEQWIDALAKIWRVGRESRGGKRRTGVSASDERAPHELESQEIERRGNGMDITWLTDRIAVGGGIWNVENMAKVGREGVTHVIDMQLEFDDTPLGEDCGIAVLWNPTDDDFTLKPPELFQRGVEFAQAALEQAGSKVFIHCAAGVHRAPMMTLALLGSMGWELEEAMELIETRRPVADFADVYVRSVEAFLARVATEEK